MIQIDPQALITLPADPALSKAALARFLNRARKLVDLSGEVELLLTSDAELKRLNRAFRNKNKATDILSFPAPPEISARHAGDLAISLETAARQAARFGHTLSDELRILILHGLLHLSGLDHETDKGEMAAREAELRSALKLSDTLIARSTAKPAVKGPRKPPAKESPQAPRRRHTDKDRHSDPEPVGAEGPPYLPSARTAKKLHARPQSNVQRSG